MHIDSLYDMQAAWFRAERFNAELFGEFSSYTLYCRARKEALDSVLRQGFVY